MADTALVSSDIEAGWEFLSLLKRHGFPVTAAAWVYTSERDAWRLQIVSPRARNDLYAAYHDVARWLADDPAVRRTFDMARMAIVAPGESLSSAIAHLAEFSPDDTYRFTNGQIDGVYIEDALVYRLMPAAA